MSDPFRGYDAWKLASPDDEADARARRYAREEGRDIDAENELAAERRQLAKEAEEAMEDAEWDDYTDSHVEIDRDELIAKMREAAKTTKFNGGVGGMSDELAKKIEDAATEFYWDALGETDLIDPCELKGSK